MGVVSFQEEETRASPLGQVRTHKVAVHKREKPLPPGPCCHPDLGLAGSRSMRGQCCLLRPPGPWCLPSSPHGHKGTQGNTRGHKGTRGWGRRLTMRTEVAGGAAPAARGRAGAGWSAVGLGLQATSYPPRPTGGQQVGTLRGYQARPQQGSPRGAQSCPLAGDNSGHSSNLELFRPYQLVSAGLPAARGGALAGWAPGRRGCHCPAWGQAGSARQARLGTAQGLRRPPPQGTQLQLRTSLPGPSGPP